MFMKGPRLQGQRGLASMMVLLTEASRGSAGHVLNVPKMSWLKQSEFPRLLVSSVAH